MADYSVDIKLAVAGARQLKAARRETTALSKEITTLNRLANKQSKTLPNSFNTLNKVLGQARGNLNKVALGTTRYFRAISDVIDKEDRLSRAYTRQKSEFKAIQNLKRQGIAINKDNIQLIRNEIAAEIKLERAKRRTAKAEKEGAVANQRRNRIIQSAAIGGGFPLLFGGGPLQAAAGALGGGIGEAISPRGGFAGSIAATAAVSSLGQFANSARELAEAVKTTSGTLELMETRSLFSSDAIQKQAKALQDQGKEAELAALLTDELTKALGPAGLGQLAGLAEQSREMNTQFGILKTSMELFISGPLTELIKIMNNVVGKVNIVNQLDQSLSQLKKENPNEFKRIIDQLKGSFVQNINPVSDRSKSVLGSFVNPSNLQVQGIPVGGFSKDILGQILQDVNKLLPTTTLPFQTNLDTGSGGSNTSGGKKDFSEFELDILNKRIELQKLSGSLLDEEVVRSKKRNYSCRSIIKICTGRRSYRKK